MHYWWNDAWSWWTWAAMTLGMVAFWGLVVWAFLAVVRWPDRGSEDVRQSPEEILAERFAAGDIDSDEYQKRLAALRSAKVLAG